MFRHLLPPMESFQQAELSSLRFQSSCVSKDEFGVGLEDTVPLSFDRISEGRPFSSEFFLSRLPIEILWLVTCSLPQECLANLALVNRDCRQLARSRQFASIKLDYSDGAIGILDKLISEHGERFEHNGRTKWPSLGACIKKITLAADRQAIDSRHAIGTSGDFYHLDEEGKTARMNQAYKCFFNEYMPKISLILSYNRVLPNLTSLEWSDRASLGQDIFDSIFASNIRHLALRRVYTRQKFPINLSPRRSPSTLTSLYIDLDWASFATREEKMLSLLIYKIVCFGAPTLESLVFACIKFVPDWFDARGDMFAAYLPSSVKEHPRFPNLRDLKMDDSMDYDPAWLGILIQPDGPSPIRSLEVNISKTPEIQDFFCTCGNLPNLELLVWSGQVRNNAPLDFLKSNPQIQRLMIYESDPGFIEARLLPLLCQKFKNLTSLSLRWPKSYYAIPQAALNQIATLAQLERLHLAAGIPYGWQYSWVIDHGALQACLANLPNLHKLAFGRDTYGGRFDDTEQGVGLVSYYERQIIRGKTALLSVAERKAADGDATKMRQLLWEKQHQRDMIQIAQEYADILPKLDFIYVGELPIRITRDSAGDATVVPLSAKRDTCTTYLRRMFGRKNEDAYFR